MNLIFDQLKIDNFTPFGSTLNVLNVCVFLLQTEFCGIYLKDVWQYVINAYSFQNRFYEILMPQNLNIFVYACIYKYFNNRMINFIIIC